MGLTLLQCVTFQTGGREWIDSTAGGCVTTPAPPSPETYFYQHDNVTGDLATAEVTSGSNWIVFGTHVRFNDITNDSNYAFFHVVLSGGYTLTFKITSSSGNVTVYDVNGSAISTMTGKVSINTTYRLSGMFKQSNSTALRVWMTEASNLENGTPDIDTTGVDMYGSGAGTVCALQFSNDSSAVYAIYVYFGTSYLATAPAADAIGDNSPLRQFWSLLARPNNTTATPDVTGGDNLDGSTTWDYADDVPKSATNQAQYTALATAKDGVVTCDDSTNGGPLGNSNVGSGTVWWNGWVFWYKTSNISGAKGIYTSWYGNYGAHATASSDGTTATSTFQATSQSILTVEQFIGDTYFSGESKYMQYGFGATGGNDFSGNSYLTDCLAAYLYEEPAAAAGRLLCINGICQLIT